MACCGYALQSRWWTCGAALKKILFATLISVKLLVCSTEMDGFCSQVDIINDKIIKNTIGMILALMKYVITSSDCFSAHTW